MMRKIMRKMKSDGDEGGVESASIHPPTVYYCTGTVGGIFIFFWRNENVRRPAAHRPHKVVLNFFFKGGRTRTVAAQEQRPHKNSGRTGL